MKSPKKIVLDLRPLQCSYKNKGIGRYCYFLAKELSKTGQYFSLIFKSAPSPGLAIAPLICAPMLKRQWLWDMFILPFHLWVRKVDVFHNFVALGPLDRISPPLLFLHKTVITIHDIHMFESKKNDLDNFYKNTMRIKLQKALVRNSAKIIFDTNLVKEKLMDKWDFPPERCETVPLGGNHVENWQTKEVLLPSGAKAEEICYLLSIGDTPNKNLALGYQILKILRKSNPNVHWIICGDPNRLESYFTSRENNWIHFLSHVSDEELCYLYRHAQMLLFPSAIEGFGIPVVEAAYLSCAIVVGNTRPMSDHISWKSELNSEDFSPKNAEKWADECRELLEKTSKKAQRVALGKEFSRHFHWAQSAKSFAQFYSAI